MPAKLFTPIGFKDIFGHELALRSLRRAFESNRAHHAYLFSGPQGIGKRTVAGILGRSILCTHGEIGQPCDTCRDCQRTASNSHPDWHRIIPDGAHIKIDRIREINSEMTYRAFEGGSRVVLIGSADKMTPEAANAILKTLEEPTRDSYFILVTSNKSQLLPTVVSRCQHVAFAPLGAEQVSAVLERGGLSTSEIGTAVQLSGGSPGSALELLEDPLFLRRPQLLNSLLDLVLTTDPLPLPFGDWAEAEVGGKRAEGGRLAVQRECTRQVLDMLRVFVRDLMFLSTGGDENGLINSDHREQLVRSGRQLTFDRLSSILDAIDQARSAVDGNVTPRLVLEAFAVRVSKESY